MSAAKFTAIHPARVYIFPGRDSVYAGCTGQHNHTTRLVAIFFSQVPQPPAQTDP